MDSTLHGRFDLSREQWAAAFSISTLTAAIVTPIAADVSAGELTQDERLRALKALRDGRARVLVATDVAARGIDVPGINLVVNYDAPRMAQEYVHRIGRTGRAGKEGKAITFVTSQEEHLLKNITDFSGAGVKQSEVPGGEAQQQRETVRKVWDFDELADIFGMVRFGVNVGKADKVASTELANLIMKRARISDFMIGTIEVDDRDSVVEIHKDVALKVINAMKGSDLKGKKLEVAPLKRK